MRTALHMEWNCARYKGRKPMKELDYGFKRLDCSGKVLTGMQALCHRGGLDQVAFTHITGDEVVEFLD